MLDLKKDDESAPPLDVASADEPVEPLRDWHLNPYIHPSQAVRAYGGHLLDLEGRDFIDFSAAWGANILGYGYPRVAEAIAAQARCFSGVGMYHPGYWELTRLLCQVIPGAEAIRYGKNGSDATMGAVRLARAVTGREHVLHRGYHGFHDWWMASTDCAGIPRALKELIEPLWEFTPEAVDTAFRRHPGQIACVIVDPMVPPTPEAAVVREIVEVTHRHGALMIFDEVVSGFRMAPGGMQEIWGIQADLACHGKGVANGMPLSVLSGKQAHMRHLPSINYGMTFEAEAISIAAALATVKEILEKGVCRSLAEKGRFLRREYARLAAQHGIATHLAGPDPRPYLAFEAQDNIPSRELRWLCIQELARAGILTIGTIGLCYSHDAKDLESAVAAFAAAMAVVRQALERRSVTGLLDERVQRSMHCAGDAPRKERSVHLVTFTHAPAAAAWDGRLHVFARGSDGQLYHKRGDGQSWDSWQSLGGVVVSSPAAAATSDRLCVFVRSSDDKVWEKSHDGRAWSEWAPVGGELSESPAAAADGARVELVVRGRDNQLWRSRHAASGWEQWRPMGGDADSAPAAAFVGPGQLIAICRGRDRGLWHSAFDAGIGRWQSLGGTAESAPALAGGDGRLELFTRFEDGHVWGRSFDGAAWGRWADIGAASSAPAATLRGPELHLFAVGPGQRVYHRARTDAAWADWTDLGPAWGRGDAVLETASSRVG